MKKLLFAIPLLMVGCQAVQDAGAAAKQTLEAPPSFVIEAIQAIFRFLGSALGAAWEMFINKFLPF